MSLNRVLLQGRLTAEPEMRHTQSGVSVANLRLAVDRDFNDKETGERGVDFFSLTAWRGQAEFIVAYFHKGDQMIVDGKLQQSQYTDKEGITRYVTNVIVESAYFCGSSGKRENGQSGQRRSEGYKQEARAANDQFRDITEEDSGELPF